MGRRQRMYPLGLPAPASPARAKVTIYEIADRRWGWLSTSAEVDDRVYVGSAEWRALHPREWKTLTT